MNSNHAKIIATIALLAETFPRTFPLIESRRRPLKIGIHRDLAAALDGAVTPDELKRALRYYVGSEGYLKHSLTGAWRLDLAGNQVGDCTPSASGSGRLVGANERR
jgi:ProP effector